MRIIVFGDVHGNLMALNKLQKKRAYQKADQRIFLGDAICLGPNSRECVESILNDDCIYIMGNHESRFLNNQINSCHIPTAHLLAVFDELGDDIKNRLAAVVKKDYMLKLAGKNLLFTHYAHSKDGWYKDLSAYGEPVPCQHVIDTFADSNADIIFYGHEHKPTYFADNKGLSFCDKSLLYSKNFYNKKILIGVGDCGSSRVCNYCTIKANKNRLVVRQRKFKFSLRKYMLKLRDTKLPLASNHKFSRRGKYGTL